MNRYVTSTATRAGKRIKLDRYDLKILQALREDGRMSKKTLSEEIGLSATRCWERMRRLETAGVIKGYHAEVDLERLLGVSYFFTQVKVLNYSSPKQRALEAYLQTIDEIVYCYHVLGTVDYFIMVMAENIQHYQEIIESIAHGDFEIDYTTFPITKVFKKPHRSSLIDLVEAVQKIP